MLAWRPSALWRLAGHAMALIGLALGTQRRLGSCCAALTASTAALRQALHRLCLLLRRKPLRHKLLLMVVLPRLPLCQCLQCRRLLLLLQVWPLLNMQGLLQLGRHHPHGIPQLRAQCNQLLHAPRGGSAPARPRLSLLLLRQLMIVAVSAAAGAPTRRPCSPTAWNT